MIRGCVRQPRPISRLVIVTTIMGLALASLLPTVRSAPGLSRWANRIAPPAPLSFPIAGASGTDLERPSAAVIGADRPEGNLGDPDGSVEELARPEWLAIRLVRGHRSDRSRPLRGPAGIDRRVAPPENRLACETGSAPSSLPLRLCRLLL